MGHAPADRLRRHVDELDLVGATDDGVGDRLALLDARDLLDDVVDRLEVLDVERRDHGDPGVEQHVDVLPALLVRGAGHVRVRELVDERDLRACARGWRRRPSPRTSLPRYSIGRRGTTSRPLDLRGGLGAAVRLDVADDDVGAALVPPPALVEHREGLADAGRGAEVDAQRPAAHDRRVTYLEPSSARFSSSTLTPGSPKKPSERPSVCSSTSVEHLRQRQRARARDPRGLEAGVGRRDVRVEARSRRRDGVDGHRRAGARPFALR